MRPRKRIRPVGVPLLALGVLGALAGRSTAASPSGAAPAVEELRVDVGGRALFLRRAGIGGPVVVLESGFRADIDEWRGVIEGVAPLATVVAYERAGTGRSDPSPEAPDSRNVARDLRAMLRAAGLEPPYVLAGHSLGATHVRVFASMYPNDVAGLVLADPGMVWRLESLYQEVFPPEEFARLMVQNHELAESWTPRQHLEESAVRVSEAEARLGFPLPRVPVVVLSGARPHGMFPSPEIDRRFIEGWVRIHKEELVQKIPGSEHVVLPRVGHMIHVEAPQEIVSAVRRVVERARTR